MKVTIFAMREWKTIDSKTGDEITGLAFDAFRKTGEPFSFTSGVEHKVHDAVEYDESKSEDLHITPKLFGGKVSWRETDKDGNMLR